MTEPPMTDEEFYDTEIQPALLALAKRCEDRGLAFFSLVQADASGRAGLVSSIPPRTLPVFRYVKILAEAQGPKGVDLDLFVLEAARVAAGVGHRSLLLAQLGVPTTPPPAGPTVTVDTGDLTPERLEEVKARVAAMASPPAAERAAPPPALAAKAAALANAKAKGNGKAAPAKPAGGAKRRR